MKLATPLAGIRFAFGVVVCWCGGRVPARIACKKIIKTFLVDYLIPTRIGCVKKILKLFISVGCWLILRRDASLLRLVRTVHGV